MAVDLGRPIDNRPQVDNLPYKRKTGTP